MLLSLAVQGTHTTRDEMDSEVTNMAHPSGHSQIED